MLLHAAILAAVLPVVGDHDGSKSSESESTQVEFVQALPACVSVTPRHSPVASGRGTFVRITRRWMQAAQHVGYLPHALGHRQPSGCLAPLRC